MARPRATWGDMDHDDEPLLQTEARRFSTVTSGPIPEFLAKRRAEKAPRTADWHEEVLTQLWKFLEGEGLITVGDFTEHNVNRFRISLKKRMLTENTIANRMRSVKAFSRWMHKSGWTTEDRLANVRSPQSVKPKVELLPSDVMQRLFELYNPNTFIGARNLAIIALLGDTGLRREEAANLLAANIDLTAQHIKAYSDKTEDWRWVPLTDETTAVLRNYLKWRDRYFAKPARRSVMAEKDTREKVARTLTGQNLFVTTEGTNMTPHNLGQILYRAQRKIGHKIHAHLFRHIFATKKALDGESPSLLKRWLGHKSMEMTDYYFDLAEDMLGTIKPKNSVFEGVRMLPEKKRGRPRKSA